jgi:hypothetical protein
LEKPKAHLELWHAVRTISGSRYLVGVVVGHPTMVNGQRIVTSDLSKSCSLSRPRSVGQQLVYGERWNGSFHRTFPQHELDDGTGVPHGPQSPRGKKEGRSTSGTTGERQSATDM